MRALKKLTQRDIDSAKPIEKEYTLWDALSGFGLRIRPTGARTFTLVYRLPEQRRLKRYTIGKPGVLAVEEARKIAKHVTPRPRMTPFPG